MGLPRRSVRGLSIRVLGARATVAATVFSITSIASWGQSTGEQPAAPSIATPSGPSFISDLRLPEGEDHVTVPLLPGGNSFYARVKINGRDAGIFFVDTGATQTVISQRMAKILGLPIMGRRGAEVMGFHDVKTFEARILRIDSMAIGSVRVVTRRLVDFDLMPNSRRMGKLVSGIIGMDILSRLPLTLDLAAETMTFHARDAFAEPAKDPRFDLVVHHGTPHVQGRIGDQFDALLLIDTGDAHLLHVNRNFVQEHPQVLTGPVIRMSGAVGLSGTPVEFEERYGRLDVFGRSFDRVLMSLRPTRPEWDLDRDGAVGTPLLRRFRITFDFAGQRMWAKYQPPNPVALRLAAGLDANETDLAGRTPLFAAIEEGDVEAVEALIEAGADVNVMDNLAHRPLMPAAFWGELQIVQVLLQAGAAVNVETPDGDSPLSIAARRGHLPVVEALLEAGARVNQVSGKGRPALSCAAVNGHGQIVDLLLSKGARVTARGGEHRTTALHRAASSGHVEVMKKLLAAGAEVHAKDKGGRTSLHSAAASGSRDAVNLLLAHGADVHGRLHTGVSVNFVDVGFNSDMTFE